jgi:hypothetical protein
LSKYSVSTKLWMLGWPTAAGLATATSGGAIMHRWKGTGGFDAAIALRQRCVT